MVLYQHQFLFNIKWYFMIIMNTDFIEIEKKTSQALVQHLHQNTDENDDIIGVEVNFTGTN